MIRAAAVLICLALAGCVAAAGQDPVAIGDRFTLGVGGLAPIRDTSTSVRFVGVIEDSRCPRDTTCIWAGEVKVEIEFLERSKVSKQMELKLGESADAAGLHVTLVDVEPQPASNVRISAQGYRATMVVEKVGQGKRAK